MDRIARRQRIETLLADWFRRDGWQVVGEDGCVVLWVCENDEADGYEITLNLSDLASFLEQETEGLTT